jgi:hypothetical protein
MAIVARAILLGICVATLSACGNSYDTKLSALCSVSVAKHTNGVSAKG